MEIRHINNKCVDGLMGFFKETYSLGFFFFFLNWDLVRVRKLEKLEKKVVS